MAKYKIKCITKNSGEKSWIPKVRRRFLLIFGYWKCLDKLGDISTIYYDGLGSSSREEALRSINRNFEKYNKVDNSKTHYEYLNK